MTEKISKIISRVISSVFALSVFVLVTLLNNKAEGAWYLYAQTAAYTLIFTAAVAYIVMFFVGLKKTDSWGWVILYIISIPVFLFGGNALDCYNDFFGGSVVCTTDVYKVPVEHAYEDMPYVYFSHNMEYRSLYISEDTHARLLANPYDESRIAVDEALNEKTHPHIRPVEIKYYPNTEITADIFYLNG